MRFLELSEFESSSPIETLFILLLSEVSSMRKAERSGYLIGGSILGCMVERLEGVMRPLTEAPSLWSFIAN